MLSTISGLERSPGWTPILITGIGNRRSAAAAASDDAARARLRLAQVITGPNASRAPGSGDHTLQ
jgi:hypothetical protein